MFIVLLSFNESLATQFLFLNNELCMVRPTVIDMNLVDFYYYPFMISLNNCTGSCNVLSCMSYHITIDNYFYFLPLCKTRKCNIKWKRINLVIILWHNIIVHDIINLNCP